MKLNCNSVFFATYNLYVNLLKMNLRIIFISLKGNRNKRKKQ